MDRRTLMDTLEQCPVIAAVHDRHFEKALNAPSEVIFLLGSNILTIPERIRQAHRAQKCIFLTQNVLRKTSIDSSLSRLPEFYLQFRARSRKRNKNAN